MRARLILGFAIVLAMGCGSGKFVSVSGKVTMNNKALAGAKVIFQPIAQKGIEAGPAASGTTDENGVYSLKSTTEKGTLVDGAMPAKYNVIFQDIDTKGGDGDTRRRGGPSTPDRIPLKYALGGKEAKTFEVPPGGTDKADFQLTSP
jgi:hypothetical protein